MYKKTITYKNFDGKTVSNTYYFNITKMEFEELNLKYHGNLKDEIQKRIDEKDQWGIYSLFKEVVLIAFGEKTDDKRFVKNANSANEFEHSEAYSELVYELAQSEDAMKNFMNQVLPTEERKN